MKKALEEWLMLGVGVLMIAFAIFGTMWTVAGNVNDQMEQRITTEAVLPE